MAAMWEEHLPELLSLKSVALKHRQGFLRVYKLQWIWSISMPHHQDGWKWGFPLISPSIPLRTLTHTTCTTSNGMACKYNYISIYHPLFTLLTPQLISRTPCPIIEQSDHIIGALAGQPHDPSWSDVEKDASQVIWDAGERASFNKQQMNQWGSFYGVVVGVSFGGGQMVSAECSHQ